MSARVDIEEIETTKSEKLLAFVLAVFLLIGGLWIYFEPLDRGDEAAFDSAGLPPAGSPQDHEALERRRQAERRVRFAERSERAARENLEVRREAYRTAIEAGRESRELERG